MKYNYLDFNMEIGRNKPENIVNKEAKCPFCNYNADEKIIDKDGDILLIHNKYQVLDNSLQLLVIEGKECNADIPDYSKEHMVRLMEFSIKHWLKMIASQEYASVLFFKNHGPLSGGTMRHPHMQIVGLRKQDITMEAMFSKEQFQGIKLAEQGSVELNLSTRPRVGFNELNIIMEDLKDIGYLAEFVQQAVDFLMNRYPGKTSSYNLFFYYINEKIYVKIIPRYATSPLFIGYNIELIPNDLADTAKMFRDIYYPENAGTGK